MTRRAGLLILALVLVAAVAPLARAVRSRPDVSASSFTRRRCVRCSPGSAHRGRIRCVLADRLEQRFEPDLSEHRSAAVVWRRRSSRRSFCWAPTACGRDILSRLFYGARTSIGLALVATLGALAIGALAGAFAGYRGGWIDESVMRLADFVIVLPMIYVVLVLRAVLPLVLPPSAVFVLVASIFVLVGWPFVAKGVRAIVAVERDREYVLAARSLGAGGLRLLTRHLASGVRRLPGGAGDDSAARVHPCRSDAVVCRSRISGCGAELGHDAHRGRQRRIAGALSVDARRRPWRSFWSR